MSPTTVLTIDIMLIVMLLVTIVAFAKLIHGHYSNYKFFKLMISDTSNDLIDAMYSYSSAVMKTK